MEDIRCDTDNFHFIYRVAALILNSDKTKVLLYYGNGADFYMLPGGKVKGTETSKEAIQRELAEELGYKNLKLSLVGINEEIVKNDEKNIHQLALIYKCIYTDEIKNLEFKGIDTDYNNFKWVDIKEIDTLKTYPKNISEMIYNDNSISHIVEVLQE